MTVAGTIQHKLTAAFQPVELDVIDESHLHAGHAGARPEGETHFRVIMRAAAFDGVARLDRQRAVMDVLRDELDGPVHALALKLSGQAD